MKTIIPLIVLVVFIASCAPAEPQPSYPEPAEVVEPQEIEPEPVEPEIPGEFIPDEIDVAKELLELEKQETNTVGSAITVTKTPGRIEFSGCEDLGSGISVSYLFYRGGEAAPEGKERILTNSCDDGKMKEYYCKTSGGISGGTGKYNNCLWGCEENQCSAAADFDGDGDSDIDDFMELNIRKADEKTVDTCPQCDLNNDGVFDGFDIDVLSWKIFKTAGADGVIDDPNKMTGNVPQEIVDQADYLQDVPACPINQMPLDCDLGEKAEYTFMDRGGQAVCLTGNKNGPKEITISAGTEQMHATRETADRLARCLGGTVVDTTPWLFCAQSDRTRWGIELPVDNIYKHFNEDPDNEIINAGWMAYRLSTAGRTAFNALPCVTPAGFLSAPRLFITGEGSRSEESAMSDVNRPVRLFWYQPVGGVQSSSLTVEGDGCSFPMPPDEFVEVNGNHVTLRTNCCNAGHNYEFTIATTNNAGREWTKTVNLEVRDDPSCVEGTVNNECTTTSDCNAGLECVSKRCIDPGKTPLGGVCRYNSDCQEPYVCNSGICGRAPTNTDENCNPFCGLSQRCDLDECKGCDICLAGSGETCSRNADCKAGYECKSSQCTRIGVTEPKPQPVGGVCNDGNGDPKENFCPEGETCKTYYGWGECAGCSSKTSCGTCHVLPDGTADPDSGWSMYCDF